LVKGEHYGETEERSHQSDLKSERDKDFKSGYKKREKKEEGRKNWQERKGRKHLKYGSGLASEHGRKKV